VTTDVWKTLDQDRARELVLELMAIPGKSCEEGRVAQYVVDKLSTAGFPAEFIVTDDAHTQTPKRGEIGNLVLRVPGELDGPRRMLSAHLDTVPICVGSQPVVNNQMVKSGDPNTGLGADNRAGVAVLLATALELKERKLPHPPLTFCWFVQEEIGLQGSRCLDVEMLGKPELAFNWDGGSATKLTIGATGGYRMEIDVRGVASHAGGAPEWGVSAIAIASIAIADLHRNGWHGLIQKDENVGTSNVGFIHGGEATNVVTDRVQIRAEARSHDSSFREEIVSQIKAAFDRASKEVTSVADAHGSVSFEGRLDYDSFRLERNEPSVQAAVSAVESLGETAEFAIANGGLDANWLYRHGIPAVSLGCGQIGQHTVGEALDLEQFYQSCQIALQLALGDSSSA